MIAFNLVGTKKNSGTKTFNINFLKEISRLKNDENIVVYVPKFYLDDQKLEFPENTKIIIKSNLLKNFLIRFIWMHFFLPVELKVKKIKVLFSSSNYSPLFLNFLNIKSVLFVHTVLPWLHFDLIPGYRIKNFFIKKIMQISIQNAKYIIVPSNYAKDSLIKKLKIVPEKINVINLGADHVFELKEYKDEIANFNYSQKYILSVISCVKYHNILNLLKSYKDFINEKNSEIKFVLVLTILDKEYFKTLKNFVKNNFDKNQVIILPNLEKKYLSNIYRNSLLYIFTSYSETFGITLLEAMNFDLPLLLSKTQSFEEINGNIPEYFDPDNVNDIKNKLIKIVDFETNNSQVKLDKNITQQHLKNYLWKNTVQKTYEVLKKIN